MTLRPSTLTITLVGDAHGNISVRTDLLEPSASAGITPVQALGMGLLMQCMGKGHDIVRGIEHVPALAFAKDVSDPDQYGWSVDSAVVKVAAEILDLSQRDQRKAGAA